MKRRPDELAKLAGRVSDGFEVDWGRAEDELSSSDRAIAGQLRAVEEIARGYRNLDPQPEEATETWGPLEVLEPIGAGAFSRVYRARDPQLERQVALKLHRNRDAAEEVVSEARRLSRVRHPNVLTIYGADVVDGQPGIWTELIEGETLASRAKAHGPMGEAEAVSVGLELCRALAAVHGAGIIHRDIKAQNVMREQGGRLVLMDFGAGLVADQGDKKAPSGTPLYMAPELLRGEPATVRSDLYSLGVLLFFLLTGQFPVQGPSVEAIREAHERGHRKLLRDLRPELSSSFNQILDQAVEPDRAKRFPSAGALGQALAKCIDPGGLKRERKLRPFQQALSLLLVAAALFSVVYLLLAPQAGAYVVEASLVRVTAEGAETLVSGAAVHPGDRLYLEFESSRDLNVYILNRDERGETYLLFPLPGQDLVNPLPARQRLRLPGSREGEEVFWQVTSVGGQEHFLLIASPDALADFEERTAMLDRPQMGRPVVSAPLGNEALRSLRGVGGLSAAVPGTGGPESDLFDSAVGLAAGSGTTTGVWVRKIELVNP